MQLSNSAVALNQIFLSFGFNFAQFLFILNNIFIPVSDQMFFGSFLGNKRIIFWALEPFMVRLFRLCTKICPGFSSYRENREKAEADWLNKTYSLLLQTYSAWGQQGGVEGRGWREVECWTSPLCREWTLNPGAPSPAGQKTWQQLSLRRGSNQKVTSSVWSQLLQTTKNTKTSRPTTEMRLLFKLLLFQSKVNA